jgi:predicted Zn-dependent peptidase
MNARLLGAAALGLLVGCAHGRGESDRRAGGATFRGPLGGEAVLAARPRIGPLAPFAAPRANVHVLKNGLKLFVVEKQGDGIEALQLVVKRGSADDPPPLPGVASLAMDMLEAGSAGRTQTQMAAAADAIGASLHAAAGADGAAVSGSAMVSNAEPLVALFADLALRPNFAEDEWKRIVGQRQADLLAARADPTVAAARALSRSVYGDHPYGRPAEGTVESVQAMKLDDAKSFVAGFDPAASALVAVGGVPEARIVELLTKAFESWPARGAAASAEPPQARPAPAERPRLVIVDFPDKPQTVMRLGEPSLPRSSPDVLALRLWNSAIGGSFTSRLSTNLRERHGYTYGAGSRFVFGVGPGPFIMTADVKTEVTADALKEALSELQRGVDAPITQAELDKAKALLAFDVAQLLEHAGGAASAFGQLFLYGLPDDEFQTYVPRLQKLTLEDVQAAVRRVVDPARMTIVLAGDAKKVEEQLRASSLGLPPPERRDVVGEKIAGP